jgi:hypothetical protein
VYWPSGDTRPVRLGNLGGVPSQVHAVNGNGWCVGASNTGRADRATLWITASGTAAIDLNSRKAAGDTKLVLTRAYDVNSNGWIVGFSAGSPNVGFLLTPW